MNRRRLYFPVVLMLLAIVAVASFQVYWLIKNFREEKQELSFRTNVLFREAIQHIRADKMKLDTNFHSNEKMRVAGYGAVGMMDAIKRKVLDSMGRDKRFHIMVTAENREYARSAIPDTDSIREIHVFKDGPGGPGIVKVLSRVDSLQDSIGVKELSVKYAQILKQEKISVPFLITNRKAVLNDELRPPFFENDNEVTIGFNNPVTFRVDISDTTPFVLRKMWSQILVSLLLVALTVFSFTLLLRSLVQQRKLTQIKNDFISNITHELKTPIATVSVAIEALRNFDALQDPEKTKEYLAISSNELQRLSFLVDKVLKLSMFEKHQVELKEETIDLALLVKEVVNSMKLQFEKYKAQVNVQMHGYCFEIQADRLHITSVLFNLLDNALKYSKENPTIHIELKDETERIQLQVTDNGKGIPAEFHKKIFDKFFRVPAGDTHNVKGYGLGLSYVAYVIQRHYGSIEVESQPGIGSRFIIKLPAAS
ncbi:HAMP domain-containing histidine kinase [Niastella caeni]|uniref:histidine kinase n=1 Tax=Niastella caeni TaxID=2569763 RepID=A0A4S8I4U5_9BACT|nr:HAMP domain-containing sensor histidine kinase [Niastella caeni]THU41822.1 HAMP domain-containing histidine kinase [Niastella caeni]